MPATLNRKNKGKQFTAVDTAAREIFHWHRPGEHLPILVQNTNGDQYIINQIDVDLAQENGKTKLGAHNAETIDTMAESLGKPIEENGKGSRVLKLHKGYKWATADWALYGVIGAAAMAVGYEVVKAFA